MRETGIGTSLILIATGAVLAFAITVRSTTVDINAVGAILMVVGIIGLLLSFVALGDWGAFGRRPIRHDYVDDHFATNVTPPHEHRRVETTDVVVEDESATPHVERVRRIS